MSASTIISTLWGATDAENLSDKQLSALSCEEGLSRQLKDLAEVVIGVGCLVAEDKDAGNFQEAGSVAQLLFTISNLIGSHAEASIVASDARTIINRRKLERAANQTAAAA